MQRTYSSDKSGTLFDHIKAKKKLAREGDLAKLIGANASEVSEIRHGKRKVSDVLLVRICERTGISLRTARAMLPAKKEIA